MKRIIRKLTDLGTFYADSKSEKRNVILTNYISLITSTALLLLILTYYLYYGYNLAVFLRLAGGALLFLLPLLLNRFGAVMYSRILLSWLTPFIVFGISILDLNSGELMSPSSFVGLRLFLLAGFCFPFLIFNLKNWLWLSLGLSASVFSILFFDQIFKLFRPQYLQNIMSDPFYTFNNVRALIAMLAIGITLILLKRIVERNEEMNLELLNELERKNKVIKQQAEAEVYKLNEKLTNNLQLLKVSESRYRSLFEQASDFIAINDFEGNFIDANESWCREFGYTREELMKLKSADLIDREQLSKEPFRYADLKKGAHVLTYRRMVRKNKTIVEVEANVKKLQEDKILVIARDVTKLREAQRQIELNEAKFRGAFENSAIGMAMVSLDLKWTKVNKELSHILGYTEEQLINKSVSDFTHPEDKEGDYEVKHQLLIKGEITYQREKRYIHRNGGIVWVNLHASLVKDQNGVPLFFVSQIENITLSKKTKELLSVYEANMTSTINNTDLMIWSVDREYKLLMFNNPFFHYVNKHFGVQLKVGNSAFASLEGDRHEEITKKWIPLYNRAIDGHRITFEETRYGMDLQYSLSPILKADQVIGVSVFAKNVTENKERERELVEANKKIGELKLMALRSVMSPHFIFNVLNSIQFFITKNDRVNALHYLSTFSKLIRSVLTHSVKNKIRLIDELDMLKNYVSLEMTRFENKFDFTISVEPHIETQSILIPSLLIQPYVENAILHGLYNKKGKGKLSITLKEHEGILTFIITDNGIGRKAAKKLQKYGSQPHQSMGISITEERLNLINRDQKTTFEIEDLINDDSACGTKVTIGITYTTT